MKKEWLRDPQRWNHYAYVRNNPLQYVDPNGGDLTVVYSYGRISATTRRSGLKQTKLRSLRRSNRSSTMLA